MTDEFSKMSVVGSVLREPTLHFVVLALSLFAVNAVVRSRDRGHVIEIDGGKVAARVARIEANLGAPLTVDQRQQVEEAYIDEQILVREARSLGLQEDEQVDDLLAQKMLDVLSADVIQPTPSELAAYYRANGARYATPARVTVDELVVGEAGALPRALRAQLMNGVPPQGLTSDLPTSYGALTQVTLDDLDRVFGASTAALIFGAPQGEWVGPHPSVRGQHWFRVTDRADAVSPPLDAIRAQVRVDWIGEQEQARLQERVRELRSRYDVVLTGGSATR